MPRGVALALIQKVVSSSLEYTARAALAKTGSHVGCTAFSQTRALYEGRSRGNREALRMGRPPAVGRATLPRCRSCCRQACDHKRWRLPRPVCAEVKRAESPLSPPSLSCPRSRSTACTQPSAQANGFRLAPPEGEARFQAASPVGYGLRHVCDLHTICAALCSHVCRKR